MKLENPFKRLSKFEWILWLTSVAVTIASYLVNGNGALNLIASLIGATALIFVAKGLVIGQALCIIFATLYGYISFECRYFGEMVTYVFMSGPMAIFSLISWMKNPYEDGGGEVKVRKRLLPVDILIMSLLAVLVTIVFYFVLKFLGTANLTLSTVSITTSFLACWLTMLRSPYYALAYAANDIVLIGLWVSVVLKDLSYLPMVICFLVFLANDIYGFYNWKRISKRQLS